jgi:WD40 repeat protein
MPDKRTPMPPEGDPVSTTDLPQQPLPSTETRPGIGTGPSPRAAATDWPPISGYEILGEVGRGGMGIVYKARQLDRDRIVALKVIRQERLAQEASVRRFRREAQAAARLTHPNIVAVWDFDQSGDTHYIAMEFVEGVTLQWLVDHHGPLPVPVACDYVRQTALGLQHAAEQGLVHRDIKPANLMVGLPGQTAATLQVGTAWPPPGAVVKVLDMGVARLHQLGGQLEDSLTTLTQDGAVIGTPDYVAPEQLEDAHGADIRADLYSLGCTFYFLLTGQVPFPGTKLLQKLDQHRWTAAPAVNQLRPEVPQALAELIARLMAKRPADRYQTPAELAAALEQLARTGQLPAPPRPAPIKETRRLSGHTDGVACLTVSADGKHVLSGGKDRSIRLWELASGKELRCLVEPAQDVAGLAFAPDGRQFLSAAGATLYLWDLQTGRVLTRFTGHTSTVRAVAFAPGGRRALSGGDDRTVRFWDVQTGRDWRRFTGHTGEVTSVAFAPDGRLALSGSRDGSLRLWDLQTAKELPRFAAQKGPVLSVAWSPDGRQVLATYFDTTLRLFDVEDGRELRRFQGHTRMVAAVAFSPDGQRALSGSHDQTVRLWDVESGGELCCFEGHGGPVTCVAFAPDGRHAFSGGLDKTICWWQLPE